MNDDTHYTDADHQADRDGDDSYYQDDVWQQLCDAATD